MLTNRGNLSLPIAIWLASDDYDHNSDPSHISATGLLKPVKSIILSARIVALKMSGDSDILDQAPAKIGSAIHQAIETAVVDDQMRTEALTKLGYPPRIHDMIKINPPLPIDPDNHNIFMELRHTKQLGKWTISGKFDIVENGRVKDVKKTSTYNWVNGGNDSKYTMQGSIYRWLVPEIITDDYMDVEYIMTDWKAMLTLADKKYPKQAIMSRTLRLKSIPETENFINGVLNKLEKYRDAKEADIPPCSPAEVWQRPTKYAYYKKPGAKRATAVFDNVHDAGARAAQDGNVGHVVTRPGEVKFCTFCPARPICIQAERYVTQGLLKL